MGKLQPILKSERLEVIDVIRGFAIFGILLVNMAQFSYPYMYIMFVGEPNFITETWSRLDHWTRGFLDVFIQGKFITMFSFLFGFGMVMMLERAKEKGEKFVPLYARRLLALLVFGVFHAFFIWDGDILMDYAILGFILLLFRNCKPKTLIIWAISLFSLYALPLLAAGIFSMTQPDALDMFYDRSFQHEMNEKAKNAYENYQNGTFVEVFKQRIHDRLYYMEALGMWPFNPLFYGFSMIPYFSMFLLGAAFSKLKIFYDVKKHNILIKRIWWMGLLVGLPLNSLAAYETSFLMIGAPFLMLFYVMSMTLCMQRPTWQNRCKKVAAVGRTAFSNYILQSIVCTLLFYSYGLGLYGKVNPFVGLWISVAIFAMQMAVSTWWLKKYRMGPLEWVWRTMTYGRVQRLKRVEEMN